MDDLARRDFTINAIAYHPIRHEWRDPFHGAGDLEHKLIRSVGDANWRFPEDQRRSLRALRVRARVAVRSPPRTPEAAKAYEASIGQWRDKYPDAKHVPEVRRWLSQVGEYADDLLVLLAAGTAPRSPLPKVVESIRAAKDPLAVKDLALKGDDLLAAGVRPGPEVGETLERPLPEGLEDPTRNTRHYLLSPV